MFIFDRKNLTGIDIGSYAVKAIKIKGTTRMRTLESVGYSRLDNIKLPDDSSLLSQIVRNLFRVRKIKRKKVATVLSGGSLTFAHLYLPPMPKKDMKDAVHWEMRKQVTFSPEELVCDFTVMGEVKRGEESMISLIAFGARRHDVEQLLKVLETASLETVAVSVTPMAMLSAFDYNNVWEDGANYSMVDIGDSKATLAIFKDMKLKFAREIPIGGKELTLSVMQKLACSEEEAEKKKIQWGMMPTAQEPRIMDAVSGVVERLASEVRRSFDYYQAEFREGGISKIFLCGGTSRLKGIDNFFANVLGIPSFIDDPLRNIKIEPKRFEAEKIKEFAPDLTVVAGLALSRYSS